MTTIPPSYEDPEGYAARLRYLITTEIDRIVDDLDQRQSFLLEIWGRHRDRGPLLDTLFSRYKTLSMTDLTILTTEQIALVEAFYHELDQLRLYFSFTQDMPTTMSDNYAIALHRIALVGADAVELLGGVPDRPDAHGDNATLLAILTAPKEKTSSPFPPAQEEEETRISEESGEEESTTE